MGSSKDWLVLASEEADRLGMQSRAVWDSLRVPLGPRFEGEYSQAQEDATAMFGPLHEKSAPAERLAHSYHMLSCAKEVFKRISAPNDSTS